MKNLIVTLSLIIAGLSAFADNWVFTLNEGSATAGDVTDGVWKFRATIKGTDITFGNAYTNIYPDVVTPVDFSKPVTDGGSTTYRIVKLNVGFGYYVNGGINPKTGKKDWSRIGYEPICLRVGQITMPAGGGLTEISDCAFCECVNATGYLQFPSTVTTIGNSAFKSDAGLTIDASSFPAGIKTLSDQAFLGTKLTGDLILTNVTTMGSAALNGTDVTSAKFGPGLTTMRGNYHGGVFSSCAKLTNVVFDANSSVDFQNGGTFYGCTKLKQVDLSAATKISLMTDSNVGYSHFDSSGVEKVVFSEKLTQLGSGTFASDSNLSEVHFTGMPPSTLLTPVFRGVSSSQNVATFVHLDEHATTYDYAAAKEAWDALTEGKTLLEAGSTWSQSMAGSAYKLRPLTLYVIPVIGERGHWVYDNLCDPAVVSNGVWSFKAAKAGNSVLVKDVLRYPSSPTEIDFSKSVTDTNGIKLSFGEISPCFGITSGSDKYKGGPAAGYVSKVVFPTNEFYTIGEYAFCGCTNLTEVVPCVPDFVTTVGVAAFENVQLKEGNRDVRLYGISYLDEHLFRFAPVTSVVFGPDLKNMRCHWHEGAFYGCPITNVVFDAAMTNCTMVGSSEGPFTDCATLACPMDMSGFADLTYQFFQGTKVPEIIVGSGCRNMIAGFVGNDTALTNVIFKGRVPDTFGVPYLDGVAANQKVTTQIYWKNRKMTNSVGKCWMDYIAGDTLRRRDSTWAAEYVKAGIDLANRPLVAPDAQNGFKVILR